MTTIVANAISRRLEEEDLQGPWDPLTDEEEELMMLSGRWPGHNVGDLRQRNYELPSSLLKQLRTASWRVSQGPLADLEEEGLTYHSMDMPPEDVERRNELIEKVYAPPRIVREALDRYGPQPTEEEDQGAE
ncbi:hypothetical protein [Streptomyces sp. NPDC088915]|uniref:hypothetical protein n=1 Tax=Streptomyces sp. NPDC088915 TaxID=3365912 RepID=UPI003827017F